MLLPRTAAARRTEQTTILSDAFGIESWMAHSVIEALAPTSESPGLHKALIDRLGLRLSEDDLDWLKTSMAYVRDFDAAVRPLFALSRIPERGLVRIMTKKRVLSERMRYIQHDGG